MTFYEGDVFTLFIVIGRGQKGLVGRDVTTHIFIYVHPQKGGITNGFKIVRGFVGQNNKNRVG